MNYDSWWFGKIHHEVDNELEVLGFIHAGKLLLIAVFLPTFFMN
jgi:hypothetical protein